MRALKHALLAHHRSAPKDIAAKEEVLVRYLYRGMQDDAYDAAYSVVGFGSVPGGESG